MDKRVVITASDLHRAAGNALKRVALKNEHLVVERDGYPIAVLISYQEYEQLIRERNLINHRELVSKLGKEAEKQGFNEEQLVTELEKTKEEVYRKTYGNK